MIDVACLLPPLCTVASSKQALSDPQARRNWEQYGHPDGYQPWTFDLAVPGWLRPGKDTGNGTLALYGLGYMVSDIGTALNIFSELHPPGLMVTGKMPRQLFDAAGSAICKTSAMLRYLLTLNCGCQIFKYVPVGHCGVQCGYLSRKDDLSEGGAFHEIYLACVGLRAREIAPSWPSAAWFYSMTLAV